MTAQRTAIALALAALAGISIAADEHGGHVMAPAPVAESLPATQPVMSATQPAVPATQTGDPAEASADAVIRALLDERKIPVLPSAPSTAPASAPATVAPEAIIKPLPMPPGAMVFNRLGRLVREPGGTWWTFRFESEKSVLYEPPMRVLPNQQLEAMEAILETTPTGNARFVVTGEVLQYRGEQYLLIRKKLVKRSMDGT